MSTHDEAPPPPQPLRVPVADSHTHLDMQSGTVDEALRKAASVGVTTVVQVGCDVRGSQWAADTAAAYGNVHAAVALHPNEAPRIVRGDPDGWSRQGAREPGGQAALDAALAEIDRLAALPQVKGVGETGLDYFRTGPEGKEAQEMSFRAHIEIAKRHGKALVIHDREAHADVLRILKEEGAPERTVFHCYSGGRRDGGDLRPGRVLHVLRRQRHLQERAEPAGRGGGGAAGAAPRGDRRALPDAGADRGRPNAPYLIPITVRAMAAVRGIEEDALATAVAANTARAFGY
ncbi:Deoxyribonuclease OS=Streptomyces glaucescens OX=1907 GN=SGLAU_14360 PE=4 SV=1 [Streptomyces glaucescens]